MQSHSHWHEIRHTWSVFLSRPWPAMCYLMEVPYRSAARTHCLALIMIFRGTSSSKKALTTCSSGSAAHQSGLSVSCMLSLCLTAPNEHLVDHGGDELRGSRRAPLRGCCPPSAVKSSAGCHMHRCKMRAWRLTRLLDSTGGYRVSAPRSGTSR